MTLGKYVNKDTFIHRLDPRNKFVLLFVFMVVIFLINPSKDNYEILGWMSYALLLIFFLVLYKVAKLKFSMIFKSLKPMWFMMLFLFVANMFIYKEGILLINWWIFKIYLLSITQTLKIVIRLALLIMLSTLFTATTKPLDITVAIDDLFSWLKIFKINVHILSMTISIALRFIPTILDETYRIMKAQASRGVDFKNGKFKEKIVAITSLIIPLFISAISRSDELANAMEARNYNPLAKRTSYRKLSWNKHDSITIIASFIILAIFIVLPILIDKQVFGLLLSDSWWVNMIKNIISIISGWF
ncbi:MAG: energy-coupling factor transporter transmembrane protein EcfT [Erysipelotrichaceae bacterium]|nr:energy-coupling factor transporter transmembrane protein EcfT [Erysipelotrichaceae bacterium]